MEAARHPHHLSRASRQTPRPHGAARRHCLRHEAGAILPARRPQGSGMRRATTPCRILVRARFDLDALF